MNLTKNLKSKGTSKKVEIYQRFFKTAPGQYGHGDVFLGLTMPEIRGIAKQFQDMELKELQEHLKSKYHEERMASLLIALNKYESSKDDGKKFFDFYLKNTKYINNWDLVDVTAPKLIGHYLFDKPRDILYKLAVSKDLWEKRISIVSTYYFISKSDFKDTLKISEILLEDKHDLIHKAVGWMLREVGKRDISVLENFLKKYYKKMPRTMLRYSIEKFPEETRKKYLKGEI